MKTRRLMPLLALLLMLLLDGSWLRADEATDDYSFATGLYKKEKWVLAEEAFQKFVTKHPKHQRVPLARFYLGQTQLQNAKYADARKVLRSFVADYSQSPDAPQARFSIAECSYFLDEYEVAITELQQFEKAISASAPDPNYETALAYLGDAQRRLKRYPDAIASFEKSIKLFDQGRLIDETKFGLAQSLEASGQADRAIEIFREIADSSTATRADAALLQLANLLFAKEQHQAAAEAYLRLENDFPKSRFVPTAQLNAGFAFYRLGQFAKAMAVFDRAQQTMTQSVQAGYWKGLCSKALGDYVGAADILASVAKFAGKDPLAESVGYQLADSHFRAGRMADAETAFLDVVTRWPAGKNADQSLYFAIECALEQASKQQDDERTTKLKQTELLLEKFARDFATSGLRLSHLLQRGQFLSLRGAAADLVAAEKLFQSVIDQSQKPQTQGEARFRLARLRQSGGNRNGALDAIKPLVADVIKTPEIGFIESLVLYAGLANEAGQFDEADRVAEAYLQLAPKGGLRDQALSVLAFANTQRKDWDKVASALQQLATEHSESPLLIKTTHAAAESAYKQLDWDRALTYYLALEKLAPTTAFHPLALSGLGWAHFQKGSFEDAETQFRKVVADFPKHELAAESAFMIGDSLQKAGKQPDAGVAFSEAFRQFKPSRHAFLAGLQAARISAKLGKVPDADKSYAELDAAFPEAKERDQLLNEWARVLSDAQDFARADELFRKLVEKFPDSSVADNARYSLAESSLVAGKLDDAAKEFRDLATRSKSDKTVQEDSLYRLIGIGAEQHASKDVVAHAKSLHEKFPESRYRPEVLFQLGNAQLSLNDFAAAEKSLSQVSQLAEDATVKAADWLPQMWPLLAESQFRQKKYDDVLKTADRARQLQPTSKLLHQVDEVVGRAYKSQAKFDEARAAFSRVLNSETGVRTETACKSQFLIGETYLLQKNFKAAHESFQKVYILYPTFPDWQAPALYQVATCEEDLKQTTEAITSYKTLIKEFPQSPFAAQSKERLAKLGGG